MEHKYLLDSNICIYMLRGKKGMYEHIKLPQIVLWLLKM